MIQAEKPWRSSRLSCSHSSVLDGAAALFFVDQLDQADLLELAHVVADVADRRAELGRQFFRAGGAFGQDRERLHAQRVGDHLHQRLIDALALSRLRSHKPSCRRSRAASYARPLLKPARSI
jgi:hypothetical protein